VPLHFTDAGLRNVPDYRVHANLVWRFQERMPDLPLAGLSILIVEDEPLLRRQLAAHLERLGAM
jgi:hypothetical protein